MLLFIFFWHWSHLFYTHLLNLFSCIFVVYITQQTRNFIGYLQKVSLCPYPFLEIKKKKKAHKEWTWDGELPPMITQQFSYVATTIILYYLGKQRSERWENDPQRRNWKPFHQFLWLESSPKETCSTTPNPTWLNRAKVPPMIIGTDSEKCRFLTQDLNVCNISHQC